MSTPPPATDLLCVCAWCGRWRDAGGYWHDPPAAPRPPRQLTHGICPKCVVTQMSDETPPYPVR